MTETSLLPTLIQGGGISIALALIWFNWKERNTIMSEWKAERSRWYETVNNHMVHDQQLHEQAIASQTMQMSITKQQSKLIERLVKTVNLLYEGLMKK